MDITKNLIKGGFDTCKPDIALSDDLNEDAIKTGNPEKAKEAISKNPLNALAWYNYGIFLQKSNNYENAFIAFLTTACINDWDQEAWGNCLLISWHLKNIENLYFLYKILLTKFGLGFVNYIAEHIADDPKINDEDKPVLIKAFHEIAEKI